MLKTPDGKPRCAIVTTAHLSDQERQFVTTLILSKLVTWMRKQSGTTDLRALLYMDEVAGYLPPTAMPPTKKPIMTLMKQARAFGVGVVLSTQNPVDVDYKALSNAGTWMIGRLQTDQDKQRLLDGMSAASGGVDVNEIGSTDRRARQARVRPAPRRQGPPRGVHHAVGDELPARPPDPRPDRPPDDRPESRDESPRAASVAPPGAASQEGAAEAKRRPVPPPATVPKLRERAAAARSLQHDEITMLPEIASGVPVRWADVASPWLATIGGDPRGTRYEAAIVARVALRYDDDKADLVHDEEYEAVLFPLADPVDPTPVDRRRLRRSRPAARRTGVVRVPTAERRR